jgi:hypothetical protein
MIDRSQFRTKSIGVRVCEADFNRLQEIADASGNAGRAGSVIEPRHSEPADRLESGQKCVAFF